LGVKKSIEIIIRFKEVAGKGEFQDGRQNGEKKETNECVKLVIHY